MVPLDPGPMDDYGLGQARVPGLDCRTEAVVMVGD